VRSLGYTGKNGDAAVVGVGREICRGLTAGNSVQQVAGVLVQATAKDPLPLNPDEATKIVASANHNMCPTAVAAPGAPPPPGPPPAPRVLSTADQAFLATLRNNGVTAGQDGTLIVYAHKWCEGGFNKRAEVDQLVDQGFGRRNPIGFIEGADRNFYVLKVAAHRVYCPNKIPTRGEWYYGA
jgi:hypothetical protein